MPPHATADWTPKQQRAALLLASGRPVRATAKAVKAGERTVYDWLDKPEFCSYVARVRGDIFERSVGRLARSAARATAALDKLLADPSPAIRLRAAVAVLDSAVKLRTHVELDARIAFLEQVAADQKHEGETSREPGRGARPAPGGLLEPRRHRPQVVPAEVSPGHPGPDQ